MSIDADITGQDIIVQDVARAAETIINRVMPEFAGFAPQVEATARRCRRLIMNIRKIT